jgi:hypothetical protein
VPVDVSTHIGNPTRGFTPIVPVDRYEGEPDDVEGAFCLTIDGVRVTTLEEWDDVNWLWPFVVNASDECERSGRGETMFSDQPLRFSLERIGSSDRIRVAAAGLVFFDELERLIPGSKQGLECRIAVLEGGRRR